MTPDQREAIANAAATLDGMALELRRCHGIPPGYNVIHEPEVAYEIKRIKGVVTELYDIAGDQ